MNNSQLIRYKFSPELACCNIFKTYQFKEVELNFLFLKDASETLNTYKMIQSHNFYKQNKQKNKSCEILNICKKPNYLKKIYFLKQSFINYVTKSTKILTISKWNPNILLIESKIQNQFMGNLLLRPILDNNYLVTKFIFFEQNDLTTNCIIVRPCLNINRYEIKNFCNFLKLPVYPDKTNQLIQYSRNRIRKQILPVFRFYFNPQIDKILCQFIEILNKDYYFLNALTNRIYASSFIYKKKYRLPYIQKNHTSYFYNLKYIFGKNIIISLICSFFSKKFINYKSTHRLINNKFLIKKKRQIFHSKNFILVRGLYIYSSLNKSSILIKKGRSGGEASKQVNRGSINKKIYFLRLANKSKICSLKKINFLKPKKINFFQGKPTKLKILIKKGKEAGKEALPPNRPRKKYMYPLIKSKICWDKSFRLEVINQRVIRIKQILKKSKKTNFDSYQLNLTYNLIHSSYFDCFVKLINFHYIHFLNIHLFKKFICWNLIFPNIYNISAEKKFSIYKSTSFALLWLPIICNCHNKLSFNLENEFKTNQFFYYLPLALKRSFFKKLLKIKYYT